MSEMQKTLDIKTTVRDVCDGFVFDKNEGKGLYGLGGRLIIQPEYQRNYIYGDTGYDVEVVRSLLEGIPLGFLYFVENDDGKLEVLDGQQRITSFARFVNESWPFAVEVDGVPRYFSSLSKEDKEKILNTELTIWICKGTPEQIQRWFERINIAGMPLVKQELLNAAYHGPFVSAARTVFSNSKNANMVRWKTYVSGDEKRQAILETALKWVSDGDIKDYMARHRYDDNIDELVTHFESVIDWVDSLFEYTGKEMCKVDWGKLYRAYHGNAYSKAHLTERVEELMADVVVRDKKNIFEYLLGGEQDTKLFNVRVFDEPIKKAVYKEQSDDARIAGVSNCPLCALGHDNNRTRIYKLSEMDADHVTAWSNGGASDKENCQMLCKTHNRAKGNR